MSFDLHRMLESKRAYRQTLAALPVAEKLRLLDELRAAALTLGRASVVPANEAAMVKEGQGPYPAEPKLMETKAGQAKPRPGRSA